VYPAFQGVALNVGGNKDFQTEFPLGEGWLGLNLRFLVTITNSTGSGVLAQAMARIVENILIDTDRDGIIVNASGRMLFQRAIDLLGAIPNIDSAFAATTGTYDISIPIHFADPRAKRPEDSILDTARYNRVRMTVSIGGVSRLVSTAGDLAVTGVTMSCEIVRYRGVLDEGSRPNLVPLLDGKMVIDPNTQQFIELPRSPDLGIKRIVLFTSDNATQGQGTADDAVLNLVSIEDQDGFAGWNQRLDSMIAAQNKELYGLETRQAGRYVHDYLGVGASSLSAEFSGNKSKYRVTWTNGTPTSRFVHLFIDGLKTLKPAA
jgi:hypothetical protein